jgi:hypothetical protein
MSCLQWSQCSSLLSTANASSHLLFDRFAATRLQLAGLHHLVMYLLISRARIRHILHALAALSPVYHSAQVLLQP